MDELDDFLTIESDEDSTERDAVYNGYLIQLMEAGNDPSSAQRVATMFTDKRMRGEVLNEAEDLVLMGLTDAIDFDL